MNATARMAKEKDRAIAAERPSAPGKKEAGMENIPMAIAVSPKVLSHRIHLRLVVMILGFRFLYNDE